MNNDLLKLKASLCDAMAKWIEEESSGEEWLQLNTSISENVCELMSDSAFNILLAQKDLSEYLRSEKRLDV